MAMKINIAYPPYGTQKIIEIDDEKKLRPFYDKRIAEEVPADHLGDEFKGYVFKITGGFDKQGFAMKQGVLVNHRVRLVLDGSTGHYRPKRDGCRKRKSVRGCIVGPDLSIINVVISKKGDQTLPGLTDPDSKRPSLRGPKRASKIRKLWGLSKDEDVRQFVSRKKLEADEKHKKPRYKSPKIQRLVTPQRLQRKRRRVALKQRRFEKNQKQASEYAKLLNQIRKEKRQALLSKKRTQRESHSVKGQSAKVDTQAKSAAGAPVTKDVKSQPAQTKSAQTKPAQTKPAQQSGATKPAQSGATKPAQSGATKPAQQSGATKPAQQSGASKPAATKGQTGAAKPAQQTAQPAQQKGAQGKKEQPPKGKKQ